MVKKDEVLADATINAFADKIYALYVDIYNYSIDATKDSYQSGISILKASDDSVISSHVIAQTDLYRPSYGSSYYRTPLLKAMPNQEYGYLFQGDYAYSYTVSFNGEVPEGTRIINKDGAPQTTFTTTPGQYLEFYVELPADKIVGNTGTVEVNVTTNQFRRAAPVLWKPVSETAYHTLLENFYIADSASQSMTVSYTGIGGVAQVIINKTGEQVSGYQTVSTAYGDVLKPVFSQLPLAGSRYEIYIISADGTPVFTGTDGELYIDGDKLFPGYLTSTNGQTSFDVLPMDIDNSQTEYKVVEIMTTGGYLALSALEQSLLLTMNPAGLASGSVSYQTERVKVEFGFNKIEEYYDATGTKAYRPVAGIAFGVYSTTDMGTIPAGSLIGVITSDASGYVDGSSLDLPVNKQFNIKEIGTKSNLTLDTNTYTLDTTVADGYTNATITVPVKNTAGTTVDTITNYLRPGNFTITRQVEMFDALTGVFSLSPIDSAMGQIGIYSDASTTVLVKTLSDADYASGTYHSGNLPDGTYYIKDLGVNNQYINDSAVYSIDVVAGETKSINLSNALKTTSVKLTKLDATNASNKKAMANVTFKMTLSGKVVSTAVTNALGEITFEDVKVGYTYEFVETVPVGYNIPGSNPNLNLTTADGSISHSLTVENVKTVISGNIRITAKDESTGLSVQGLEHTIYAKSDTGFTTALGTIVTDAQGSGVLNGLPAAEYVIKETKTLSKYMATANQALNLLNTPDGDTVQINISVKPVNVVLDVSNTDEWTNAMINGAKFGLYASSNLNTPIAEFVINTNGKYSISNVLSGTYVLKQIQAPAGYVLNPNSQSVTINTQSASNLAVMFKNRPVSALVKVVSVDANTSERLQGASFDLFLNNDTALSNKLLSITTNSNGQADIQNARINVYKLVEQTAPVGYKRQSVDVKVDLSGIKDGDIVTITVKYSKTGISENPTMQIERPQTGVFDNGMLFILLSGLMIILGLGVGALSLLRISDND